MSIVEAAVLKKRPGMKYDLEVALRKHKPHFVALLKNPVRFVKKFEKSVKNSKFNPNFCRPEARAMPIWSGRLKPRGSG